MDKTPELELVLQEPSLATQRYKKPFMPEVAPVIVKVLVVAFE